MAEKGRSAGAGFLSAKKRPILDTFYFALSSPVRARQDALWGSGGRLIVDEPPRTTYTLPHYCGLLGTSPGVERAAAQTEQDPLHSDESQTAQVSTRGACTSKMWRISRGAGPPSSRHPAPPISACFHPTAALPSRQSCAFPRLPRNGQAALCLRDRLLFGGLNHRHPLRYLEEYITSRSTCQSVLPDPST